MKYSSITLSSIDKQAWPVLKETALLVQAKSKAGSNVVDQRLNRRRRRERRPCSVFEEMNIPQDAVLQAILIPLH
jgi:hypothetical protein